MFTCACVFLLRFTVKRFYVFDVDIYCKTCLRVCVFDSYFQNVFCICVILIFTGIYNDFIFALTFGEVGKQPVMAALNNIVNSTYGVKEHNVNMAATLLTALPTLLIYLLAGKFFIRGLTSGSLKG